MQLSALLVGAMAFCFSYKHLEGLPTEDIFKVLDSDLIFFVDDSNATLYNTIRKTPVIRDEFAAFSIDLYKCPDSGPQAIDHHPLHDIDWQHWQDKVDAYHAKRGSDLLNSFALTHSKAAGVPNIPAVRQPVPDSASASSASAGSPAVISALLELTKQNLVIKTLQSHAKPKVPGACFKKTQQAGGRRKSEGGTGGGKRE